MEQKVKSLSWSRINSWLTNRQQFVKTYFLDEPFFETKEILFGKMFGKILETGEFENCQDLVLQCLTNRFGEVKQDNRAEKILEESFCNIVSNDEIVTKIQEFMFDLGSNFECELKQFVDGVCVLGYADNSSEDLKNIFEFKTGKMPWTQEKVDNHGQLAIYCLLTFLEKGYLPEKVELIWFETANNDAGQIILTGRIERFKYDVKKHEKEIFEWQTKIPEIFDEIQKFYIEWLEDKDKEVNIDNSIFYEYSELEREKKLIEEKQKTLKEKIDVMLKEQKIDNYKLEDAGIFYYTERKKWNYSEDIIAEEEKVKNLKKDFEKNNTPELTYSLTCRIG